MSIKLKIPSTIDTSGLVSRWLLDGNATDSVGGRNGTWTGNAKYRVDQKLGNSVALFYGSSYIGFSATGLPSGSSSGTIMCLVRAKNVDSICPFSYGGTANNSARSFLAVSGTTFSAIGTNAVSAGMEIISDGVWHQLSATYNGSSLLFYVDGVLQGSGTFTLATELTYGRIGKLTENATPYLMNGSICDVRIYSTVKTAAQILAIAQFKA